MRIVEDASTPTGQPGILIECDCGGHPKGTRAIVRAAARDGLTRQPVRIHGFVNLAHSAWSQAASTRQNGPWKA